jgi:hypothetical protein
MSVSVKTTQETLPAPPHCPHCSATLAELGLYHWVTPQWLVLAMHCPSCRKLLHMQSIPIAPPESALS